jgi:hypothetical protein
MFAKLSLEKVLNALIGLGLSRVDAEIYVYTAKNSSQKIIDLKQVLNYSKMHIARSLKNLIATGIIKKEGKVFFAMPFEEALELLIEHEKHKAQSLQESEVLHTS